MVNFRLDVCTNSNKLLISCVLVSTGAGFLIGWSWIFNSMLRLGIALKENTYMEKLWLVNPMPLYLEIYALNWTNPEDIYKPGVKPRFQQIGPFSFREIKTKGNVTWNANNTVSFRQYHSYHFVREKSVADLSLPITSLNPVLVSAAYTAKMKKWGFWMRKGMQVAFTQMHQELAITKPFGQYLFEGYYDPMVALSAKMPLPFIPKLPMDDKFAWFFGRNETSFEGDFNMGTSYDNFGVLESWNFANRTNHYQGSCGHVSGASAGELHRPYPNKHTISIFVPDMCRNMPLDFEEEESVEGVIGRKYTAGKRFLDNGTLYPENKCFCPEECFPSGAVNISSCKYGAPGFVSLPNFHGADDYYLSAVEGLKPVRDKHEFYITLEPLTGITLRVAARLQLNLLLEPAKYLTLFQNVPKLIFPVLWFEEVVQIPDFLLVLIKILLYMPLVIQIIGALLMSIGFFLCSTVIYKHINSTMIKSGQFVSKQGNQHTKRNHHLHALTIKELVPLNEKEKLRVVYETDVQLVGDVCS